MGSSTRNWKLIKKLFLSGKSPKEIGEIHDINPQLISNRASKEKWILLRESRNEDLAAKYKDEIEELVDLANIEVRRIISDPQCRDVDKLTASKLIYDMAGLKKQTIDNNIKSTEDMTLTIINKPIKPVE